MSASSDSLNTRFDFVLYDSNMNILDELYNWEVCAMGIRCPRSIGGLPLGASQCSLFLLVADGRRKSQAGRNGWA